MECDFEYLDEAQLSQYLQSLFRKPKLFPPDKPFRNHEDNEVAAIKTPESSSINSYQLLFLRDDKEEVIEVLETGKTDLEKIVERLNPGESVLITKHKELN